MTRPDLDQLSSVINGMTPVAEQPFGARCKSRKEKNKLASRACRLKKKAQHEANKVKCHGLLEEHSKLIVSRGVVKKGGPGPPTHLMTVPLFLSSSGSDAPGESRVLEGRCVSSKKPFKGPRRGHGS